MENKIYFLGRMHSIDGFSRVALLAFLKANKEILECLIVKDNYRMFADDIDMRTNNIHVLNNAINTIEKGV